MTPIDLTDPARRAAAELLRLERLGQPWPADIPAAVAAALQELRREIEEQRLREHARQQAAVEAQNAREREAQRIRDERLTAEQARRGSF